MRLPAGGDDVLELSGGTVWNSDQPRMSIEIAHAGRPA